MLLAFLALGATFTAPDSVAVAPMPGEKHFKNIRQLTFGGQNAEAYWSRDCKRITFQTMQPEYPDEQIVVMNADGSNKRLVSTGKGRCTCSYFAPNGKRVFFSSTHAENPGPQKPIDRSKGYVWMVNPEYKIYSAKPDGTDLKPVLTWPGYVAETTIAPNGKYMAFTATKDGDLEIYRANLDGSNVKRLTDEPGYDGGPFVSWDSKKIAYRRDVIDSDKRLQDYKSLLSEWLVRPSKLEIWVMDADGQNKKQITKLGCASFAPFISPDNKWVIFSSNYGDPKGRTFEIFRIHLDGTGLEQVTHGGQFDGFPMFSRDGKKLLFASNRYGKAPRETNVFVADWVE